MTMTTRFRSLARYVAIIGAAAIAGALAGCAAVDSSLTENPGQYPDVISLQVAAVKSSLQRKMFFPGNDELVARAVANHDADFLILRNASLDTLQNQGFYNEGPGYKALHLGHSYASASDRRIYQGYCTSLHGQYTTHDFNVGPNKALGILQSCSVDGKLAFATRIVYYGAIVSTCSAGACEEDHSYDTVSLTPPVAPSGASETIRSELNAVGYRGPQ